VGQGPEHTGDSSCLLHTVSTEADTASSLTGDAPAEAAGTDAWGPVSCVFSPLHLLCLRSPVIRRDQWLEEGRP